MKDLDKELWNIIYAHCPNPAGNYDVKTCLEQIKQCFADAGYLPADKSKWMTGQEWYDRFMKTAMAPSKADIAAARFAAGLTE